ncbi:MAG: phosphoribosylpyrophosphate synthetase [Spirosomaceae bacterium]|nr:phosphoribosylpyrophosphate synthetase [Spirosomataceae bacterium]
MKTSQTAQNFDTLSQAMQYYNRQGYIANFKLKSDYIENSDDDTTIKPDNFTVDFVHRFEGMTNPADNMIMYAITCDNDSKGIAVEAYGADSVILNDDMRKALQEEIDSHQN